MAHTLSLQQHEKIQYEEIEEVILKNQNYLLTCLAYLRFLQSNGWMIYRDTFRFQNTNLLLFVMDKA